MHRSLYLRLRPFLRRDARARLISAGVVALVMVALAWLGTSALTRIDNEAGHALRVQVGLELPHAVCGGPIQPACSYDDREQAKADREAQEERALRIAILEDLYRRCIHARGRLDHAAAATPDLRPAPLPSAEARNGIPPAVVRDALETLERQLIELAAREDHPLAATAMRTGIPRDEAVMRVAPNAGMTLSAWLSVPGSDAPPVDPALVQLIDRNPERVWSLVAMPSAPEWHGAWLRAEHEPLPAIEPVSVRYRSAVSPNVRMRLLGTTLLALAAVMLVVVAPIVTATQTARERESGTLPVLRMTGLDARELALAMSLGPNLFALTAAAAWLGCGSALLLASGATGLPGTLGLLAFLTLATQGVAVGLGDVLGQRVNAFVVGGVMAALLLGPGSVGTALVVGDLASTGLLCGPIPVALERVVSHADLSLILGSAMDGRGSSGPAIFAYAMLVHGVAAMLFLRSWRRRLEDGCAAVFLPWEGGVLALACMGCSAWAIIDLCERIHVQSYDQVNLVTSAATAFLVPILAWLLSSSFIRPARQSGTLAIREIRRGFARFQVLVAFTGAALGIAYAVVLQRSGLANDVAEPMWATLVQCVLAAETLAATVLYVASGSRHRHRVAAVGAFVVALQLGGAVGIYNMEVAFVALHKAAANPFFLAMDASPYWLVFLVLLWAAGFGLILAALLRERDRAETEDNGDDADDEHEGDEKPPRWLH